MSDRSTGVYFSVSQNSLIVCEETECCLSRRLFEFTGITAPEFCFRYRGEGTRRRRETRDFQCSVRTEHVEDKTHRDTHLTQSQGTSRVGTQFTFEGVCTVHTVRTKNPNHHFPFTSRVNLDLGRQDQSSLFGRNPQSLMKTVIILTIKTKNRTVTRNSQ